MNSVADPNVRTAKPAESSKSRKGLADQWIVIHHEHDGVLDTHSLCARWAGRTGKTAPRGSFFSAQSLPPCASMIDRLIGNPIPMPCGLVVKKGANNLSACSASIPGPVSFTDYQKFTWVRKRGLNHQTPPFLDRRRPWTQWRSSPD